VFDFLAQELTNLKKEQRENKNVHLDMINLKSFAASYVFDPQDALDLCIS
jgi:hypothetical protein